MRGLGYDEQVQMLAPRRPLQMKPDPTGTKEESKGDTPDGECEDTSEIKARLAALEAREALTAESEVRLGLDAIEHKLASLPAGFDELEVFLESSFVSENRYASGERDRKDADKAYREDHTMSPLEAIGAMLDLVNSVRSIIDAASKFRTALKTGASSTAKAVGATGAALEGAGAAKDAIEAGATIGDAEAPPTDSTHALVGGVNSKVNALRNSVTEVERFVQVMALSRLGDGVRELPAGLERIANHFQFMDPKDENYAAHAARIESILGNLQGFIERLSAMRVHVTNLSNAHKAGGGESLVRGTGTRGLFDEFERDAALRGKAVVMIEERIEVLDSRGSESVVPWRAQVSVGDAATHERWARSMAAEGHAAFGIVPYSKGVVIPVSLARGLKAVGAATVKVPPSRVFLHGPESFEIDLTEYRGDPEAYMRLASGYNPGEAAL